MLVEMDVEDWEEQVEYLSILVKSANFGTRERAGEALERLNAIAAAGLVKVGPKGYIHGWIYVGPQAVGSRVFHSEHGHGHVSRAGSRTVGVTFDNGHHGAFEHGHGDGAGTHFAARSGNASRPAARPKTPAEAKPVAIAVPTGPTGLRPPPTSSAADVEIARAAERGAKGYSDSQDRALHAVASSDHQDAVAAIGRLSRSDFEAMSTDDQQALRSRVALAAGQANGYVGAHATALDRLLREEPSAAENSNRDHRPTLGILASEEVTARRQRDLEARLSRYPESAAAAVRSAHTGTDADAVRDVGGLSPHVRRQMHPDDTEVVSDRLARISRNPGPHQADAQELQEIRARNSHVPVPEPERETVRPPRDEPRSSESAAPQPPSAEIQAKPQPQDRDIAFNHQLKDSVQARLVDRDRAARDAQREERKTSGIPSSAKLKLIPAEQREAAERLLAAAATVSRARMTRINNQAQLDALDEMLAGADISPEHRALWQTRRAEFLHHVNSHNGGSGVDPSVVTGQGLDEARKEWRRVTGGQVERSAPTPSGHDVGSRLDAARTAISEGRHADAVNHLTAAAGGARDKRTRDQITAMRADLASRITGAAAPKTPAPKAPRKPRAPKVKPEPVSVHDTLHQMINADTSDEAHRIADGLKGKDLHAAVAATPIAHHFGTRDTADAKRRRLVRWATSIDQRNSDAIRGYGHQDPAERAAGIEANRAERRAELARTAPAATPAAEAMHAADRTSLHPPKRTAEGQLITTTA